MHRGQTEEKKKENLRREKKKFFFFLLYHNGPASFVRCSQLFVIKFFLLGPPGRPGEERGREGRRRCGASPFLSLTHTGPFFLDKSLFAWAGNRSWIPDPTLVSAHDESTGVGVECEGKRAGLGLDTGPVTWLASELPGLLSPQRFCPPLPPLFA